jgi:hypothetical protein
LFPRDALGEWLRTALAGYPQKEVDILVISDARNNPPSEVDAGRVGATVYLHDLAVPDICAVINLPEQTTRTLDYQSRGANGEKLYLTDVTPIADGNYAPINWVYLIECPVGWACDFGYVSGTGTWLQARRFNCYADAKQALENPSWHNDPDGVRRGRVVRLRVTIRALAYRPGKTSAGQRAQ